MTHLVISGYEFRVSVEATHLVISGHEFVQFLIAKLTFFNSFFHFSVTLNFI